MFRFTDTQDWFSGHIPTWASHFPHVRSPAPRILEIGTWEGRSAVYLLQNLCKSDGGELVTIDHYDLLKTSEGRERFSKVKNNLSLTKKPFRMIDDFSVPGLMQVLQEEMVAQNPGFDWVYIDGSHESDDTFLDGELAWRVAKEGAIFIFDDYRWPSEPEDSIHHPKRGIDAFLELHKGQYTVLSGSTEGQYQMILQKTTPMRIGFTTKAIQPSVIDTHTKLDYGVSVGLVVDSGYALPAAVAIQSMVQHTTSRISIYILDCGLSTECKDKLRTSVPETGGKVTINFLALPEKSMAKVHGNVWAKLDLIEVAPVERIIYVDADVLFRADVKELWDMELEGYWVGAAADVGHPKGTKDATGPYFNAGVLLLDLAKARRSLGELKELAHQNWNAEYKDQDVLNEHVGDAWKRLSLKWNAQGLGTYACNFDPDRAALPLHELANPAIVHFTGPVHPPLGEALNPWVQPFTAKPWGYLGAPGNPYSEEWWSVVEETQWKGWRMSEGHREECGRGVDAVFRAGRESLGRISVFNLTVDNE